MNALKHGLEARTIVLPGEDQAAYSARLEAWRADYRPRNPEEQAILERAVALSWQLDRAIAVQAAHLTERIRNAQSDDARRQQAADADADADEFGQRLLAGPPAPKFKIDKIARRLAMMYASPFWSQYTPLVDINRLRGKRLVMPVHPDDPGHPQRLLRHLESTDAGCRWLLDRWAELRRALEADPCWTADQRLAAVRLLGREPIDALDDPRVQAIYLDCFVLDPAGPRVLNDQAIETTRREFHAFLQLLAAQGVRDRVPPGREAARRRLLALVDGVIAALQVRAIAHAARAEFRAASAVDRLAFDSSAEGERLRKLQSRLLHALHRTIDELTKARRRPKATAPRQERSRVEVTSRAPAEVYEEVRIEPNADDGPAPFAVRNEPNAEAASGPGGESTALRAVEGTSPTSPSRHPGDGGPREGEPTSEPAEETRPDPCPPDIRAHLGRVERSDRVVPASGYLQERPGAVGRRGRAAPSPAPGQAGRPPPTDQALGGHRHAPSRATNVLTGHLGTPDP
jgi:hypothetical protein